MVRHFSGKGRKYWAFISYSHADRAWGEWLHHRLETFRVPGDLVGRLLSDGTEVPSRLMPVFRDRAELPGASHLGPKIRGALEEARYLIVVCSPDAARSAWVAEEIRVYKAMGRADRVLPIIVGGKPHAAQEGEEEDECFPLPLRFEVAQDGSVTDRPVEPLAADARPGGDGKQGALLKLLAGILEVGFDQLARRDAERQRRRLRTVAAVVSAVALVLAGVAAYAIVQRNEARAQRDRAVAARNEAERLLQYMLFDLREKLAPLGRLDVAADVEKQVDAYYRELGVDEQSPDNLRRRASAQINKGDRLAAQGRLAEAREAYGDAEGITRRLAALDPSQPLWRCDLSVCLQRSGDVLLAEGRLADAERAFAESLANLENRGSSQTILRTLTASHDRIATVRRRQGRLREAFASLREALRLREDLARLDPANPEWAYSRSLGHVEIGATLQELGEPAAAEAEYRRALTLAEELVRHDPDHARWRRALATSRQRLGMARQALGDSAGARALLESGLAATAALAEQDPTNAEWRRDLASAHAQLGRLLLEQDSISSALSHLEASRRELARLVETNSSNARWQQDLANLQAQIGAARQASGDAAGALRVLEAGAATYRRLAAAEPANLEYQRDLARLYGQIGHACESSGELEAALAAYEAAVACGRALADAPEALPTSRDDLALAHARVAQVLWRSRRIEEARARFEAARAIWQELADQFPGDPQWPARIQQYLPPEPPAEDAPVK